MLNFERGMDGDNNLQDQRRNQSYRAIPILNEWHRIWNKKQATAVHLNRFGEDIYCPGGKGYRWNADEMTMESVTFGHPGNQKKVTLDPKVTQQLGELESGFRFENDGLRVRLKLKPKKEAKQTSKVILNPGTTILGIADDFIPTAEGLKWEYDIETSLRNADSKKTKLTITNVSFKNKRLTQRSIREGNTYESISKIDNGIYSIQSKGSEMSTVYKPAYTYAPKEFRLGYHHQERVLCEQTTGTRLTYPIVYEVRVIGLEDMKTPTTTYKNCVKSTGQTTMVYDGRLHTSNITYWHKKDIGLVKSVTRSESYTITMTLKSFSGDERR